MVMGREEDVQEELSEFTRIGIGPSAVPQEAVALGEDLTGYLTKIEVHDQNGFFTIWENGVPTAPHAVQVGSTWELRFWFHAQSTTSGSFTAAVTCIAPSNVPAAYQAQVTKWKYLTGGTYDDKLDMNMGAAPATAVTLTRIKFWMSPNAVVTDDPPRDQW